MPRWSAITLLTPALLLGLSSCASTPSANNGPKAPYLVRVQGVPPGADLSAYDPAEVISRTTPEGSFDHLKEQRRGFHGRIVLEIEVLKDGTVGSVLVPTGVDPIFDSQAVKQFKQWKFRPTLSPAGDPVVSWVHITVRLSRT